MNKQANPVSLKPQLPRGFADRGPGEIAAVERMLGVIRATYELYGFEAVETPFIEFTDALGKFLPDQDRPNEGVFSFRDDDEQWLSLRYDLTAPLARYVAENFDRLPKPYRSYRTGFVFRNEKPGPGRFRQFMQFDADTVGAPSVIADAEMCMMAADTLERLGIKRGDYVIKVNNRKVLDGVMEAIGLGGAENVGRRLIVLRAIDKLDRLGVDGVEQLLGAGRKDESGDFTKGAGLNSAQSNNLLSFLTTAGKEGDRISKTSAFDYVRIVRGEIENSFPDSELLRAGFSELQQIADMISASGYHSDRIRIDPSVVRGLEYYTGPVFEAELTFGVKDERGNPVRFGSVGGGGRYDGLVARFRGEPVPATGFSIGVSRLYAALKLIDSPIVSGADLTGPVVVLVLDRDQLASYQSMVTRLRDANIRAELYLGQAGMKAQMRYADRRRSPCVVIQGSDERAKGEVQIKDLVEGARAAASIASNEEWKAARPAQISVPEERLVEAVRDILARHRG
jgi:histidyl-tRNA synthetase